MSDEREIKTYLTGSATEKNSSGDYILVSFAEKEIEGDPFYKVVVERNCQIVKSRTFVLKDFDEANNFFIFCQKENLGDVKKSLDFTEWQAL